MRDSRAHLQRRAGARRKRAGGLPRRAEPHVRLGAPGRRAARRASSLASLSTGIEFALGAMLFFGLGDLVYKRAAMAGVRADHFLMVQSWGFATGVALYGALTGTLQ